MKGLFAILICAALLVLAANGVIHWLIAGLGAVLSVYFFTVVLYKKKDKGKKQKENSDGIPKGYFPWER